MEARGAVHVQHGATWGRYSNGIIQLRDIDVLCDVWFLVFWYVCILSIGYL